MAHTGLGLVLVGDAAPQQVADVRGERIHLPLVPVESEGEELAVRYPEVAVEAAMQLCGLPLQLRRQGGVIPKRAREARTAQLGVVDIALDLAGGARQLGVGAIGEEDGVPGVLPALVLQPRLGVAAAILAIPIAVPISTLIDPVERGPRLELEIAHELGIAGPALVLVE